MSVSERWAGSRAALSYVLDGLVERGRHRVLTVDQRAAVGLRLLRPLDGAQQELVQR